MAKRKWFLGLLILNLLFCNIMLGSSEVEAEETMLATTYEFLHNKFLHNKIGKLRLGMSKAEVDQLFGDSKIERDFGWEFYEYGESLSCVFSEHGLCLFIWRENGLYMDNLSNKLGSPQRTMTDKGYVGIRLGFGSPPSLGKGREFIEGNHFVTMIEQENTTSFYVGEENYSKVYTRSYNFV